MSERTLERSENRQVLLTTNDNPYNPFENFIEWFMFDTEKGYNTCGKLDRLVKIVDGMSELEKEIEYERAIDTLIKIDPLDLYKKVEIQLKK